MIDYFRCPFVHWPLFICVVFDLRATEFVSVSWVRRSVSLELLRFVFYRFYFRALEILEIGGYYFCFTFLHLLFQFFYRIIKTYKGNLISISAGRGKRIRSPQKPSFRSIWHFILECEIHCLKLFLIRALKSSLTFISLPKLREYANSGVMIDELSVLFLSEIM